MGHPYTVDVIVCVYNALEYVKVCLESLVAKKTVPFNLIIVDSGSDKETKQYLKAFSTKYNSLLINNITKTDYTIASNQGLRAARGKYSILLNSDTIVTLYWIEKLVACMESEGNIGIVGPMSNSASYQSVPKSVNGNGGTVNQLDHLGSNLTIEKMSYFIEKHSTKKYPKVNQVNGFCFMIHKHVIEEIGYQDEINFPCYGGEDDYCIRAGRAGFIFKIADDCYVYHHKSKSYDTDEKNEKRKEGGKRLREKHGAAFVKKHYLDIKNNNELLNIVEGIDQRLTKSLEIHEHHKSILYGLSWFNPKFDLNKIVKIERDTNVKIAIPFKYKPLAKEKYPQFTEMFLYYETKTELIRISQHFTTVIAGDHQVNNTLQHIMDCYSHINPVYYRSFNN